MEIPTLTKSLFQQHVQQALLQPFLTVRVLLTPEMAEFLFGNQVPNRDVDRRKLEEMKRRHLNRDSPQTHQGMAVNPAGQLNDGQHRCLMVIETDMGLITLITFGVPDEEFANIDIAKSRTGKTMAELLKVDNSGLVASISRQLILIGQDRVCSNGAVSNKEVTDYIQANRHALENSARLAKAVRFQATPLGVVHFIFAKVNEAKAEAFMLALESGANLPSDSPCLTLRNKLPKKAPQIASRERLQLCFAAANAYFLDKGWSTLRLPKTEQLYAVSEEVIRAYKTRPPYALTFAKENVNEKEAVAI